MNNLDDVLQQIRRIAQASRDFCAFAERTIANGEVHTAFEYIGQVKDKLAREMSGYVAPSAMVAAEASVSAASSAEKVYRDLRAGVSAAGISAATAKTLAAGEEQLVRLCERAFELARTSDLKETLKAFYPQLVICREAMLRLRARQAA